MERNVYKDAFEKKCFRLIIEAYYTSLTEKVIQLDWNENDISSELHKHIKENPLRQKWKVSTNVEADIPKDIPKTKGFSDKFPRIDFRLTTFSKSGEHEYFFEAKNLKAKLKRRYINTGIDSFISGKYDNGSLIGYLLEGEIDDTIKGINSLLVKDKRSTETLEAKNNKICPSYYESYHSEIRVLKHVILNFTDISN